MKLKLHAVCEANYLPWRCMLEGIFDRVRQAMYPSLQEKEKAIGEVGSQLSRRSKRTTKGSQAQDEYEEIKRKMLQEATFENIFPGVPMFCDPEQPQWFALQVISRSLVETIFLLTVTRHTCPPLPIN